MRQTSMTPFIQASRSMIPRALASASIALASCHVPAAKVAQPEPGAPAARIIRAELFPCTGASCSVISVDVEIDNRSDALVCIPAIYDGPAADGMALKDADGMFQSLYNSGPVFSRNPREASAGYADMPQILVQPRSRRTLSIRLDLGWNPDQPPAIDPKIEYRTAFVRLLWRPCRRTPGDSGEYEVVDLEHPLS